MRKLTFTLWGLALLFTASLWRLPADELIARIHGTVTDPSGAAVPGAQITATNTETHLAVTVPTGADGSFQFLSLPIGTYDVTVIKDGFRTFTAMGIPLRLNEVYELPVALEIGPLSESIRVEANPVQVEASVTQLGTVINRQQILDLPLLDRHWVQLEQLAPGVMSQSDRFASAFATNGSQSQQNSFLINGVDAMDLRANTPLVFPSPDAIAEFNLVTSTINAEYGRNSGAILNAVIQNGTNKFHGDAFEFYRDTFLTAHNFFQKTAPQFHQNQYGGTLGGPIWKNHTFFFLSYQGTRNRRPDGNALSNTTTVFNQDQRNGFFPDIASSNAASPFPLMGENGATYAAGTPYRVLFPSGHIPIQDFNAISQKLLAYVPLPNLGTNTYSFNPTQTGDDEQGIARIDHTFTDRDALWGTFFIESYPTTHTLPFYGGTVPGFGETDAASWKFLTAAWNHTFSPVALNELRLSYVRFNANSVAPTNPALPSSFGFTGINPQFSSNAGAPAIYINGFFNLGFSPYGPQPDINNTYQVDDNFSKVVGSHTLKFGFDGRRYQITNPYEAFNSGMFSFGGSGVYSTGDAGADFLLGIPDSFVQNSGGFQDFRTYEYYLYAQDSWKVSRDLTLNYGLGYQIDTPLVNQHFDQLDKNCFRPGQQSTIFPTAPLGLLFPGDQGCSPSGYYTHYDHFAPRFGFAYAPDWGAISGGASKDFVIRGGFGIYFDRTETELGTQDLLDAPFSLQSAGAGSFGGSPGFANPYADIATGKTAPNPFPFTPPSPGQTVNFSPFTPLIINVTDPNFTSPYVMNFNLNIQRELPGQIIFQAGYVGSQGRHLELVYEGNPISPAGSAACAADPACVNNKTNQHVAYPDHALYAPGNIFASVGTQSSRGVSSYNSFQVSLNKRFSHGLTFLAAYTWSHSVDIGSSYEDSGTTSSGISRSVNPYNFALSRGDSTFDARHRFVVNYVYDLPRVSPHWNNVFSRYVLDGWRLAGITTLQTGFPVTIGDTGYRSLTCDSSEFYKCWDTPNVNGSVALYDPRSTVLVNTAKNPANTAAFPDYYFNPNAFSLEAIGTLGNEGRNNFHGPGINNTDLALTKELRLSENRSIELRLESFNTFNHTQFEFSSRIASFQDINSSTFGRVLTAAPGRVVQLGAKFYF
jgi:Carboxypeptidase regulatory-like domain